jgi:hypothetical protein
LRVCPSGAGKAVSERQGDRPAGIVGSSPAGAEDCREVAAPAGSVQICHRCRVNGGHDDAEEAAHTAPRILSTVHDRGQFLFFFLLISKKTTPHPVRWKGMRRMRHGLCSTALALIIPALILAFSFGTAPAPGAFAVGLTVGLIIIWPYLAGQNSIQDWELVRVEQPSTQLPPEAPRLRAGSPPRGRLYTWSSR